LGAKLEPKLNDCRGLSAAGRIAANTSKILLRYPPEIFGGCGMASDKVAKIKSETAMKKIQVQCIANFVE
jgi:hypothetical protein